MTRRNNRPEAADKWREDEIKISECVESVIEMLKTMEEALVTMREAIVDIRRYVEENACGQDHAE